MSPLKRVATSGAAPPNSRVVSGTSRTEIATTSQTRCRPPPVEGVTWIVSAGRVHRAARTRPRAAARQARRTAIEVVT